MGKKHKKEHKRKRHSSSESIDNEKEKKRHHKKKHKKDKKHCKKKREGSSSPASAGEVIELDTPSPPPPPSISEDAPKTPPPPSRKRERVASPKGWTTPPKARSPSPKRAKSPGGTPPPAPSTSRDSLSIEETNALRIKLGMKPLQVDNKPVAPPPPSVVNGSSSEAPEVILIEGEEGQFVHKPAENLTSKRETEKLRARLAERKEKRQIENKYKKVKTIAEDSDDESASAWVKKSRKIAEEKEKAAKRAQELDEMDKLFGVSELIDDEIRKEKKDAYSSKNLQGLTVEHDIEAFDEGKNITLTLKDRGVLDEENGDTLINVNLLDEERYKKNLLNKKQKPFGSLYDEDEDEMEFAERSVLKKYDEEIGGEKKSSFTIGERRAVITKDKVKEKLRANMKLESLDTKIEVASDYYTSSEMAKFKKPKKLRKIRKKPLKADDLLKMRIQELFPTNNDLGSRKPTKSEPATDELDVDDTPALPMDVDEVPFKVEVKEEETEFSMALKKARKLRQIKDKPLPSYLEVGERIKTEIKEEVMDDDEGANSIVLNSTAEFCRTLGDIPTYGLAGNREEADQLTEQLDFEKEMRRESLRREEEENQGGWQDAEMDSRVVDINNVEAEPILDAEPDLGSGVAGALSMAVSKGYLEKETVNRPNAARFTHLQAQNYSIEDKSHGEDEKFGNRRDRYMGPTSDFKEKDNYKPSINLEYIDDDGRILSAKEAFRYLSHKFHGKGPGKNKIEKRMKKNEQEVLMKQMSSSDTPLGTLQMLQSKQMETQSPFVVLSGSKHQLSASTSISKSKFK